jgi:uncharacterized phage protein (TIGR02218 family)
MKSVTAGLQTHLTQAYPQRFTLATCWKVKRTDGRIQGFTEHDRDIAFDLGDGDGTLTYEAASGFTRSAIVTSDRFNSDRLSVEGILDSNEISEADLFAGRYDFAEVKVFLVNWETLDDSPSDGPLRLRRGQLGRVSLQKGAFEAELRGLMTRYIQEIVELFSAGCRADLFDTRCKVRKPSVWQASIGSPSTVYSVRQPRDAGTGSVVKPSSFNDRWFKATTAGESGASEPTWNTTLGGTTADGTVVWTTIQALIIEATIASVTNRRQFTLAYTGDAPDDLFTFGLIEFVDTASPTPANVGFKRAIKSWVLGPSPVVNEVVTFLPFPFDIAVGDSILMQAGCNKDVPDCRDTFDNIFNFRGEPHVPGNDEFFKTPNAPTS